MLIAMKLYVQAHYGNRSTADGGEIHPHTRRGIEAAFYDAKDGYGQVIDNDDGDPLGAWALVILRDEEGNDYDQYKLTDRDFKRALVGLKKRRT